MKPAKDIPQWQTNLLARYPRPVAVALIVVMNWLLEDGFLIIGLITWFIVMPVMVAIIRQSIIDGAIVFVGNAVGSLGALYVIFWFLEKYQEVSEKLPKREKKQDETA